MAKTKAKAGSSEQNATQHDAPSWREKAELVLFVVVEVICLLLFVDFLFFGFYVK